MAEVPVGTFPLRDVLQLQKYKTFIILFIIQVDNIYTLGPSYKFMS